MGDWLGRLLPWYRPEEQAGRERSTEAIRVHAEREIQRTDNVIRAYRDATVAYSRGKKQ